MKITQPNRTIYEPNDKVRLVVVNKAVHDAGQLIGYDVDLTLKIKRPLSPQELKFSSDDDIADFMANVEYDDPQTALALGETDKDAGAIAELAKRSEEE